MIPRGGGGERSAQGLDVLNKYLVLQHADFFTCHKKRARAIPEDLWVDKTEKGACALLHVD